MTTPANYSYLGILVVIIVWIFLEYRKDIERRKELIK
jgi:hypothetical protein